MSDEHLDARMIDPCSMCGYTLAEIDNTNERGQLRERLELLQSALDRTLINEAALRAENTRLRTLLESAGSDPVDALLQREDRRGRPPGG
jgi:hypothetical protein